MKWGQIRATKRVYRQRFSHPRGTLVDPQYQYNPNAKARSAGGTLNPEKRRVTQGDINALGIDKLTFDKNGKSNLGKSTSSW
jgi:hypothetical protein